jgi:hypothetical protein
MCPTHGEIVDEVGIFGLAHADGGHAETEEACVVARQLRRLHVEVEHIRADEIPSFADVGMTAADRKNGFNIGIEEDTGEGCPCLANATPVNKTVKSTRTQ